MNTFTICLVSYSAIHPQISPQEEQNMCPQKDFTQWSGEENILLQVCFLNVSPVMKRNCRALQKQAALLYTTAVSTSRKENSINEVNSQPVDIRFSTHILLPDQEWSHRKRLGGQYSVSHRVDHRYLLPGRHGLLPVQWVGQFFSMYASLANLPEMLSLLSPQKPKSITHLFSYI